MKANEQLRSYAAQKKVFLWEVAAAFGITDSQFSRRLRNEFTDEERDLAVRFIDEIAERKRVAQ